MLPSRYKCSNVDVHQIDNLVIKFYCDLEFDIEAELAKHLATHSLLVEMREQLAAVQRPQEHDQAEEVEGPIRGGQA